MDQLSGNAGIDSGGASDAPDVTGVFAAPVAETADEAVKPQLTQGSATGEQATIRNVNGEVLVISVDGQQGPAVPGQKLGPGDVVITQGDGALELVMSDGSAIFFDNESRVLIEEPPTPGQKPQFFIIQGEFSADSTATPDSPASELLVRTPVATVTVKGARMLGKAAPEAQANTFVLLPGVAGAAAGSIAVASSGKPIIIDEPLKGLQVISLFRDPSLLNEVDANLLTSEFGDGVLAYSEVADIPEIAQGSQPGFLAQIGEVLGVSEAQADPLLLPSDTLGGGTGDTGLDGGAGEDDLLGDDNDDDLINNDDNLGIINIIGNQNIDIANGDVEIVGGGDADQVTIAADPINANTVTFTEVNGKAVLNFGSATVTLDGVETVQVDLGLAADNITINDNLANAGVSDNTVILNLNAGDDVVNAPGAGVSMNVSGGAGNDSVVTSSSDDSVTGGDGNDTLSGNGQADTLSGDTGNDVLSGGAGNDLLTAGTGDDVISGDEGDDQLVSAAGADTLNGGDGTDTADFSGRAAAVTTDLAGGTFTDGTDTGALSQVENIIGTANADSLGGDANANSLQGGEGNDTLLSLGGADTLAGGNGDDLADFTGTATGVTVDLAAGTIDDGNGAGVISGIENVTGSANADALTGDANANVLNGAAGADTLSGGAGADTLSGGDGADNLTGGADNDTLLGEVGSDRLAGGEGDDSLDGGDGTDTADFGASATAVTVNLATGTATGEGTDTLTSIEAVEGSALADSITGDDNNNTISGADGDDTLLGAGGDDLFGYATSANGNDTIFGGDGTDSLRLDLLDGSNAAISIANDGLGDVLVNMTAPLAQTALLDGVEAINIFGGNGNDTLTVGDLAGTEVGNGGVVATLGDGADSLDATGATSTLNVDGGAGDDTLTSGAGNDTLTGGAGTDLLDLTGAGVAATVDLAAGTATTANTGTDTLSGIENVTTDTGADSLTGDDNDNTFSSGAGADTLVGGGGNDFLNAEDGNDSLIGGDGDDTLDGGAGTDTVSYANSANAVTVDLSSPSGSATGEGTDVLENIEVVIGSAQADSMTGGDGNETFDGGAGNDTLLGGDGDDTLIGGLGDDSLDGGAGANTVSYAASATAVSASTSTGEATGEGTDQLTNIQNLIGSTGNDTLEGDLVADNRLEGRDGSDNMVALGGNNTLLGGSGNDTLLAGTGNDSLDGGNGADSIRGGDGNDTLLGNNGGDTLFGGLGDDAFDGGVGFDTADFTASTNAVNVDLTAGTATGEGNDTLVNIERVQGTALNDTLGGSANADNFLGNDGADSLTGLAGNDTLFGGSGSDTMDGGADNDTLSGGNDNDVMLGGDGDDTLDGESGADTMTGGDGADAFFYDTQENHQDVILDFVAGTDRFLIQGSAFNNVATDGNNNLIDGQSFVTVAESLVDGVTNLGTNEATFVFDSDNNLHFDPDGDGADASFEIGNVTVSSGTLAATDFEVQ